MSWAFKEQSAVGKNPHTVHHHHNGLCLHGSFHRLVFLYPKLLTLGIRYEGLYVVEDCLYFEKISNTIRQ